MSEDRLEWTELAGGVPQSRPLLKWEFYVASSIPPEILMFIQNNPFPDRTLGCQDESRRWAKLLFQKFPDEIVEIVDGEYVWDVQDEDDEWVGTESEGHTWVEISGDVFDPTAAQFDTQSGEYVAHDREEME